MTFFMHLLKIRRPCSHHLSFSLLMKRIFFELEKWSGQELQVHIQHRDWLVKPILESKWMSGATFQDHQKKPHLFWGTCRPILFPQRIAPAWRSFSFPSSLRQTRESSPINGTQMSMYLWYSRRYELNDNLSELELLKNGKVFTINISCKTSYSHFCWIGKLRLSSKRMVSLTEFRNAMTSCDLLFF